MHELSIAENIVEIAEEYAVKNNALKILEIEIEVGEMSGVVIEALEFAMESAIIDTLLMDANIKIIEIKGTARCIGCNRKFPVSALYETCPVCNSFEMEILTGKELRIKSITIE